MAKKDKKLWIDMCAGSELKDTQGETLSVEGANIDELERGEGRFNDNHGKGFFNSLGRVTEAKKIFKSEDCENDRHKYYWEKIKAPFVYAKGYLYNDDDHPNARAAAAILRNIHRDDTPLKMKASVEGGVLARGIKDPTRLARTKIHSVALTFTPANNATLVEPLNLDKSNLDWKADEQLIKSVMHLAETNVPSFRHIQRHASAHVIHEKINKIKELAKSVGIEIDIKQDINPQTIMEKAVLNKISTNVSKISHLVKAAKDVSSADTAMYTSPNKADRTDQYQQGLERLKSDPATPQKPKDLIQDPKNAMRVKNAQQVKHTNTFKTHASKAMRDPSHINTVKQSLLQRGVSPNKINKIISNIQSHMQEPVKKSNDSVEKGEIGRAAKNLVLAGTLAVGAESMKPKSNMNAEKPKEQTERTVASEDKNKKDPDKSTNSKKQGYDERKPNAKAIFRENRRKLKTKLKKALTAGYGGAGAPTSMTGGGVFQTESLEDGKAKKSDKGEFRYINCDNCGHEQVFMGNQVKCRKCRQNFSLNKLEELM